MYKFRFLKFRLPPRSAKVMIFFKLLNIILYKLILIIFLIISIKNYRIFFVQVNIFNKVLCLIFFIIILFLEHVNSGIFFSTNQAKITK
jgi:hypothetical protein